MNRYLDNYELLKQGEYQAPSIYLAAVKNRIARPDTDWIRSRLDKLTRRGDVDEIVAVEEAEDGCTTVAVRCADDEDGDGQVFVFRVRIYDNDAPEEWAYEAAEYRNRNLLEDERMEMGQSTQIVECLTYLDEDRAQSNLMIQFAVLDAVAGECHALQDMVSGQFLSGTWLAEMAESYTPPSLEVCYVIHVIVPEDGNADDYWMHTHGLLKFGLPELEILRAPRSNLQAYQGFITTLAQRFLDDPGCWQADEALTVANSAYGEIAVRLMPWPQALASDMLVPMKKGLFRQKAQPFSGDLGEREADDVHTEPSMVVFADLDGRPQLLNDLGEAVHDDSHLMLLLPNSETARMYRLAAEKLPLFAACLKRHPPEQGVWGYMMKICCTSEETGAAEHMWFVVQEMGEETVTAELVNDPFEIPEMRSGQTYTLPLEDVTDWCIYSTPLQARIAPDDVFRLRRYLRAS